MKNLTLTLLLATMLSAATGQVFNFYGTEYFLSPDETSAPGTVLTASGTNLSEFNYSNASPTHELFSKGVYYPVQDCGNQNLWVRVQHIAHDPNGTENGFNIAQTQNSPFLPGGSTDRIGGWAGFLYDIQIFADENFTGQRANILAAHQPTQIIVESLETLFNDGGSLYEWLSFEILNPETEGWQLNSINFTGINLQSSPGFSAALNYSTTATANTPPVGFSTDFPSGSNTVYAVDLNLSGSQHSEFRMSASATSHFRYGYEFTTGGYQGMSMAFGGAPTVNATIIPSCGGAAIGSISLEPTGTEPYTFEWGNDATSQTLEGLSIGTYEVIVTDGNACITNASFDIIFAEAVTVSIDPSVLVGGLGLTAIASGGSGVYSFQWNTSETTSYIEIVDSGEYSVTVTDANGCSVTVQFIFVGIDSHQTTSIQLWPNPAADFIQIQTPFKQGELKVFDARGQWVVSTILNDSNSQTIDISSLSAGIYSYQIWNKQALASTGKLVVE